MSMIDKQTFAKEFKERLSDKLTVKSADEVVTELINQLSFYEVERVKGNQSEKEFSDMVEIYLDSLQVSGRTQRTIKQYRYKLKRFREYDSTPIKQMTVFNLRQYMAHEMQRGIADSTLQGDRHVYHAFFGWLHREGMLPYDPCANLTPVKVAKYEKEPFSDVEVEKLKEACQTLRDKAIVSFLLATGCRIGEVIALNRDDINFHDREVKVFGKGEKERIVYFNRVAGMHLKNYLDSRKDTCEALFVNRYGERMGQGGHELRLKKLGKIAGVTKVYPHRFRHTFATMLFEAGMPIFEIQMLMGHEKTDTTRKYAHVAQQKVKNSYQTFMR